MTLYQEVPLLAIITVFVRVLVLAIRGVRPTPVRVLVRVQHRVVARYCTVL